MSERSFGGWGKLPKRTKVKNNFSRKPFQIDKIENVKFNFSISNDLYQVYDFRSESHPVFGDKIISVGYLNQIKSANITPKVKVVNVKTGQEAEEPVERVNDKKWKFTIRVSHDFKKYRFSGYIVLIRKETDYSLGFTCFMEGFDE